ncbi:hypothetical protein HDU85_004540 [Gaertneriomyces sp. JEL0708]|nr:hypothetical protein HDU85_004540 [Gaertneriomyces sp. JEL0708]
MSESKEKPLGTTTDAPVAADSTTSLNGDGAAKSKNAEKNEAKRLAKLAKFEAKKAAQAAKEAEESKDGKKKEKKEKPKPKESEPEPEYVNTTPSGEKKDLSGPFLPTYNPKAVESAWYDWWEKSGFFKPALVDGKARPEGTFTIPIPPPNVTGALHLGHGLTNSIQDCLTRYHRMKGKTVLWVPGCDHAGIATQVVVEKKLMKERGITRHDLGRDNFIKEVFKWKDQFGGKIYGQLRRVGSSLDWDRVKFTMDPDMVKAVNEAFIRLHEEGIIYRDNRLVNWDTKLKTALSNLEVDSKKLTGRTLMTVPDHDPKKKYEFGVIISFAYPVENSAEEIVVATTRLETMLGDTAVAVHPNDSRYKHLHGKYVVHPFNNRRIPIIPDDYVDPEFGTGAVKITPSHDPNDYVVGKRNKLEFINIFTDDGKINETGAPFTGLQRFDAREAVLAALKEKGLYRGTADNEMVLPISERTGNIVEPLMKPQWWVNCQVLAPAAIDAVKSGQMKIIPEASDKEWFRWMENIQDWCISRQLWWGHRVPAYFVKIAGEDNDRLDGKYWVSGRDEDEARAKALTRFANIAPENISLEQDEDVLDTWFSSGLWPFSILGWPEKTKDLDLYYPQSLLETGWDILFFWVARMVMLGIKLTGQVPFKTVFCHAMVRDAHGRKMSKSLGNVIDPVDVIDGIALQDLQKRLLEGNLDAKEVQKAQEGQKRDFPNGIPQCGTDAMRFALLAYTSAGRDINLDILRVEGYRKWCNKLWNATRFALMKLGDDYKPRKDITLTGKESLADLWILTKLNQCIRKTGENLEQYNFMQATNALYQFWLYELCDVYLETTKPVIDGTDAVARERAMDTLYICLEAGLKLLHPFMPFLTEELYQRLPRRPSDDCPSIMISRYPEPVPEWDNDKAEKDYDLVNEVVHAGRSLLTDYAIRDATVLVKSSNPELEELLKSQGPIITSLTKNCKTFTVLSSSQPVPAGCAVSNINEQLTVYLLVKGFVDFDSELSKIEQKVAKAKATLDQWMKKTQIEGYEERVKPEVKMLNENKMKACEKEIEALTHALENFTKLKNE